MSLLIKPEIRFSVRKKKKSFNSSFNFSQIMCHSNQVNNLVTETVVKFVMKSEGFFHKK